MNYALVGVFVLVLGSVAVAIVLWIASGGNLKTKYDIYQAFVDESVAGLNLNAPVKYRGVDVGKVRDIRLNPANTEQVRLLFAIERGTPIKEDTEAVLKTQGLTGIAYVELSGGGRNAQPLPPPKAGDYPVIKTKPSLLSRLENVLTSLMAKLDATSDSVNAILGEDNRVAFKSALADIATVSRTIAARKDTLDAGIANAARTFENASRVTAQVGPVIDRIGRSVDAVERQVGPVIDRIGRSADAVEKMGTEVARTSASAGKTLESVGADAKSVGADVKRFTAETLPELERLLGELSVLTTSLRRVSEQTERDPRGFLFGRKQVPEGPGEKGSGPVKP